MIPFWRRTLRGRLLSISLRTTGTALLVASTVSFAFEYAKERRHMVEEVGSLADVIAAHSTAALAFNDVKAAEENLASLRSHHNIVAAVLFDAANRPFATYGRARPPASPGGPEPQGYRFSPGRLRLSRDVREGTGRLGSLCIEADLSELAARLRLYAAATLAVLLLSGFLAYLLADRLQGAISRPVLALAAAARRVSEERDFSVRVGGVGDDEIGRLAGAFNEMLEEIAGRDAAIRESEERYRQLALHDPLTGLPNRVLFADHLELTLAQSRRRRQTFAVMFLDLDQFKEVNDSAGHSAGDELLRQVAGRLRASARESDTLARIGGDEFLFLLRDLAAPTDAATLAEKLLAALREPFDIDGHRLSVTGSLGVTLYPADGADAETLLRNADISMYRAKEAGRDGFQLYGGDLGP